MGAEYFYIAPLERFLTGFRPILDLDMLNSTAEENIDCSARSMEVMFQPIADTLQSTDLQSARNCGSTLVGHLRKNETSSTRRRYFLTFRAGVWQW